MSSAPTPDKGARLSLSKISAALEAAGLQRNIDTRDIQTALRTEHLAVPEPVTNAVGANTAAAVNIIVELNHQFADLETALAPNLTSTRTPTSTVPCQDLVSSSAPSKIQRTEIAK